MVRYMWTHTHVQVLLVIVKDTCQRIWWFYLWCISHPSLPLVVWLVQACVWFQGEGGMGFFPSRWLNYVSSEHFFGPARPVGWCWYCACTVSLWMLYLYKNFNKKHLQNKKVLQDVSMLWAWLTNMYTKIMCPKCSFFVLFSKLLWMWLDA